MSNIQRIGNSIQVSADEEIAVITVKNPSGTVNLERFEAMKLRNFLNKFINGEFEEEEDNE